MAAQWAAEIPTDLADTVDAHRAAGPAVGGGAWGSWPPEAGGAGDGPGEGLADRRQRGSRGWRLLKFG